MSLRWVPSRWSHARQRCGLWPLFWSSFFLLGKHARYSNAAQRGPLSFGRPCLSTAHASVCWCWCVQLHAALCSLWIWWNSSTGLDPWPRHALSSTHSTRTTGDREMCGAPVRGIRIRITCPAAGHAPPYVVVNISYFLVAVMYNHPLIHDFQIWIHTVLYPMTPLG